MRKLEEMTLHERLLAAKRLNRELVIHLEQAFIPQSHSLGRVTRVASSTDDNAANHRTIHTTAAQVLESDDFTVGLYEQLIACAESIRKSAQEMSSF